MTRDSRTKSYKPHFSAKAMIEIWAHDGRGNGASETMRDVRSRIRHFLEESGIRAENEHEFFSGREGCVRLSPGDADKVCKWLKDNGIEMLSPEESLYRSW